MTKSKANDVVNDFPLIAIDAWEEIKYRLRVSYWTGEEAEERRQMKRAETHARIAFTSTRPDELGALVEADDVAEDTKHFAFANPFLPDRHLERLSASPDSSVRAMAAANPGTPAEVLEKLSTDGSLAVRSAVAGNLSAPVVVLLQLGKDNGEDIDLYQDADELTLGMRAWQLDIRRNLAENPSSPEELLEELIADGKLSMWLAVAGNESASPKLLERMSTETKEVMVQQVIASNPRTPPDALASLVRYRDVHLERTDLLRNLLINPSTPADLREWLEEEDKRMNGWLREPGERLCSRGRMEALRGKARREVLDAWKAQQQLAKR